MPVRTIAIVQARMGSSRLPGKVMLDLAGRPMIQRVCERLASLGAIDEVVVATSTLATELPLIGLVKDMGLRVVRGSPIDVLDRYHAAALETHAEVIVRVTSDCPLLSPKVTSKVIDAFLESVPGCDYASNTVRRTYPRGLDSEVFSLNALEIAWKEASVVADREHVTPYLWQRPERFRLLHVTDSSDRSHMRWTVDTAEDYEFVSRIYQELQHSNGNFEYVDVLRVLDQHPEWLSINRHVPQKQYGE